MTLEMFPETRVINIRKDAYDVYVGRAGKGQTGYFGNPHVLGTACPQCSSTGISHFHSVDECLRLWEDYFQHRMRSDWEFRDRVIALRGKRLGCFCAPRRCHADTYVAWLKENP